MYEFTSLVYTVLLIGSLVAAQKKEAELLILISVILFLCGFGRLSQALL